MRIDKKIANLENLLYSFIKRQNAIDDYKDADIEGCRYTESVQQTSIELNTCDISDNREGLIETFDSTMSNSDDIATLREGLMEVYELIESEE